ncbi:MAG: hypothetical protein JRI95_10415 [Deltaproteobacteria bacterium]|nr:hypothetical protein [Deltaproteobacteria bacterium]MBW2085914.1 hypothetical protein [Deltaproteobacteria bacterium]
MFVLLIKIIIVLFFAYISYDAFKKAGRHERQAEDAKFNKQVLEALARKEKRNGVIYIIIALIALAAIFINIERLIG